MVIKRKEQRSFVRRAERQHDVSVQIKIRMRSLTEVTMKATVVDVCETGIGIAVAEPLSPGQVVQFIGVDSSLGIPEQGTVMWTLQEENGCRAGLKFEVNER